MNEMFNGRGLKIRRWDLKWRGVSFYSLLYCALGDCQNFLYYNGKLYILKFTSTHSTNFHSFSIFKKFKQHNKSKENAEDTLGHFGFIHNVVKFTKHYFITAKRPTNSSTL